MIDSENAARDWLQATFDVPRETWTRLEAFADFVRSESEKQNLVARSTLPALWARHIVDSAQLLPISEKAGGAWLDLGSGAGFPGLVAAVFHSGPVTLVEPRRLRVDFLTRAAEILNVEVAIVPSKVERFDAGRFDIITARAFANLTETLALAHRFSTEKTRWVLPKGRSAVEELEHARGAWQGDFRLVPSLTDADARIVIAEGVRPRGPRRRDKA